MKFNRFKFNRNIHTSYIKEAFNPYVIHNPLLALMKFFCLGKMRIKYDWFYCLDFQVNITEFYHRYLTHFDWICRAYNIPHQFLKTFDQEMVDERAKLRVKQPQRSNIDDF